MRQGDRGDRLGKAILIRDWYLEAQAVTDDLKEVAVRSVRVL